MRALFVVRDLAAAEPIGVMLLSALLRRAGHPVRFGDARRPNALARTMESFRPHLVGYSACTGLHNTLLAANRTLKDRFEFISVFGGPHPTFFPKMIEEGGVDAVCRGEGEGAILDIAAAIDAGRPLDSIENLWVKTPGGIRRNPLRPMIRDLEALPFPDREARYQADPESRTHPVKSMLVARGCPFHCSYCFNDGYKSLYGPAWCRPRVRSVEGVLAEIQELRRTSTLEFLQFRESVFPCQEVWLKEFSRRYAAEVGLPFYCHVRADLLNEARVRHLAEAGCVSVNLGIECGDPRYRREVLGRAMSDDQILEACRLLHGHGIRILADNMLGLPGAWSGVDWKTLRINQRARIDYPLVMLFQPYPGTRLGERAKAEGFFDGDLDRIDANYYLRSPLRFPSERERRRTENLQKWFAILVEAPELEGLVNRLLELPPNLLFLSIFRAWCIFCYTFRIVPHRLTLHEVVEILATLFGLVTAEERDENRRATREVAQAGDGGRGWGPGRFVRRRLREGRSLIREAFFRILRGPERV